MSSDDPPPKCPPPISLRVLRTVEELDAARAAATRPLLLVVKAAWCERCPAFTNEVSTLVTEFQFEYCYTDAADTELTDHFNILKLPAYVLCLGRTDEPHVQSPASPADVRARVEAHCTPVLRLDADF